MPQGFYERVKDSVIFTPVQRKTHPEYESSHFKKEREERKVVVINIYEADTPALIALPGMGSRLSARIISFREIPGGFYPIDQIGETYGLPGSIFQTIKGRRQVNAAGLRKINVNAATKDELNVHPAIRWNVANAIVAYTDSKAWRR